jgi:hypothetical protein
MDILTLLQLAETHAKSNLGTPAEVDRANLMADSIRAEVIGHLKSTRLRDGLIAHLNDRWLGGWIAFVGAKCDDVTPYQSKQCMDRIRQIASEDSLNGVGARAWLRQPGADV